MEIKRHRLLARSTRVSIHSAISVTFVSAVSPTAAVVNTSLSEECCDAVCIVSHKRWSIRKHMFHHFVKTVRMSIAYRNIFHSLQKVNSTCKNIQLNNTNEQKYIL